MNKWFGCGRLTNDPEMRATNEGKKVGRFSIAINDGRRNGEENVIFVPVVTFDRQAEFVENYLHRGTKVIVEGRLNLGHYTNRDGVRVNTADIICERIEFAESKNASADNRQEDYSRPVAKADEDGFMPIPDDLDDEGLPFN